MAGRISGLSVFYATAGGLILWSGVKGATLADTVKSVLAGNPPPSNEQPIGSPKLNIGSGSGSDASSANPGGVKTPTAGQSGGGTPTANKAIALALAAGHGWGASQYNDLVSLWNRESGWNQDALNSSSGAYGVAQALGHGQGSATQGTVSNEYGGYGLTNAEAKAANSGNAYYQIAWGLNYIASIYGNPSNAWAHEESAGNY